MEWLRRYAPVLIASVLTFGSIAYATQISVPSAPSAGYGLVATSTGAYVSTTTDPWHVGSIYATSSAQTSM